MPCNAVQEVLPQPHEATHMSRPASTRPLWARQFDCQRPENIPADSTAPVGVWGEHATLLEKGSHPINPRMLVALKSGKLCQFSMHHLGDIPHMLNMHNHCRTWHANAPCAEYALCAQSHRTAFSTRKDLEDRNMHVVGPAGQQAAAPPGAPPCALYFTQQLLAIHDVVWCCAESPPLMLSQPSCITGTSCSAALAATDALCVICPALLQHLS
jgi:hypothetical protein